MAPSSLGYVVLGVADLARWETFAVDAIGMQRGRATPDGLALRIDAQLQRLVLEQGPQDDLLAAGWQFETPNELETYVERLRDNGRTVTRADRERTDSRCVDVLYLLADPQGWQHELYCNAHLAPTPFASAQLKGPGFVAGALGVGHILVTVADVPAALALYRDTLGLLLSDTIREEIRPGVVVDATFLHAATGRHHSLAIARIPGAKILSHLMVEVQDFDDVGLAHDRCLKLGFPMSLGLGRHPNDRCFSFYVQTPSGFSLEVGHGSVIVDDKVWSPSHYERLSEWGHQRATPSA